MNVAVNTLNEEVLRDFSKEELKTCLRTLDTLYHAGIEDDFSESLSDTMKFIARCIDSRPEELPATKHYVVLKNKELYDWDDDETPFFPRVYTNNNGILENECDQHTIPLSEIDENNEYKDCIIINDLTKSTVNLDNLNAFNILKIDAPDLKKKIAETIFYRRWNRALGIAKKLSDKLDSGCRIETNKEHEGRLHSVVIKGMEINYMTDNGLWNVMENDSNKDHGLYTPLHDRDRDHSGWTYYDPKDVKKLDLK